MSKFEKLVMFSSVNEFGDIAVYYVYDSSFLHSYCTCGDCHMFRSSHVQLIFRLSFLCFLASAVLIVLPFLCVVLLHGVSVDETSNHQIASMNFVTKLDKIGIARF